jgi:hypothetical protein
MCAVGSRPCGAGAHAEHGEATRGLLAQQKGSPRGSITPRIHSGCINSTHHARERRSSESSESESESSESESASSESESSESSESESESESSESSERRSCLRQGRWPGAKGSLKSLGGCELNPLVCYVEAQPQSRQQKREPKQHHGVNESRVPIPAGPSSQGARGRCTALASLCFASSSCTTQTRAGS